MDTPALSGLLLALRTIALPGLAGAAIWAAAARPLPRYAVAVGALAGLLLGWALGYGHQAAFPPVQTLDWLPWLLIAVALAGRSAPAVILVFAAGLAALTPPLLTQGETSTLVLEIAAAVFLGLALMQLLGRAAPGRGSAALAAGLGSLGLVTTLGGSIVIGGLANSAFAVAAVAWLATLTGRLTVGPLLLRGGAVIWLWLAFSARHLAEIPVPETLLSAAALATAALPGPSPEIRGLHRWLADALLPAVPALAAVGVAVWRYLAAQQTGY